MFIFQITPLSTKLHYGTLPILLYPGFFARYDQRMGTRNAESQALSQAAVWHQSIPNN